MASSASPRTFTVGQVGGAQFPLQASVLQYRSGLVAEREQHVFVVLAEAPLFVGAHYHAAELVLYIDRDGDQVLYLLVGLSASFPDPLRLVLADDLVVLDHLSREALYDHALPGVLLETFRGDEVELAVEVPVLAGEQQPLLGAEQLLCQAQHHGRHVARISQGPKLAVHPHDL